MPSTARHVLPWLEHTLRQAATLAGEPGLPPEALLCVRHLCTRLDTKSLRHAGGLPGVADKLTRQLRLHADEAHRPTRGIVPESAQAVLFETQAELLACAARDWLDGRFNQCWWWRSLLDGGALARGAFSLWRRQPMHMPAALIELDTRAGEFCQRLTATDAETLHSLLLVWHDSPAAYAHPNNRSPEAASADPRQQLLTLGLGLALARPPGPVRSSSPTGQMTDDSGLPAVVPEDEQPAISARDETAHSSETVRSAPKTAADRMYEARRDVPHHTEIKTPDVPLAGRNVLLPAQQDAASSAINTPIPHNERWPIPHLQCPPRRLDKMPHAISDEPPGTYSSANAEPNPVTFGSQSIARSEQQNRSLSTPVNVQLPTLPNRGEWIETRYGGVFYLLNVALYLGFYADFTKPRDTCLALSPWAFIARVGERLAGRGLRQDALWERLLALADSRTGPCVFSPETTPPPAWPELLHPYLEQPYPSTPAKTWEAWFDTLIPPLCRRLAAALAVSPRQSGHLLCRQNARLQFRHGHLDAHFPLNEHPIAIRLAGLDRDPGWIPAAGCDIRFFYDS